MIISDQVTYKKFRTLLLIAVGLGAFTDLFDTVIVGGGSASYIHTFHLSSPQFGLFAAMTFIGGAIGAISFGPISDRIGRRRTFFITLVIFIIGEILTASSVNYLESIIFRMIVGFGIGSDYPPAISMLSEYLDPETRGKYLVNFWIIFGIGGLASYFVAFLLLPLGLLQWRVLFLVGAVPPAIGLLFRIRLPESYRWMYSKGNIEGAKNSLARTGLEPESTISLMSMDKGNKVKKKLLLFRPYIAYVLIPLFIITFLLNVPLSGFASLSPLLLSTLHVPTADTLIFSALAFQGTETLGAVIAFPLFNKLGRWRMLLIGSIVTGVSVILMGFFAHPSDIVYLLIFLSLAGVFSYFYVPVIYSAATELYPTSIRGTGEGINIFAVRTAGIMGTFGGTYFLVTIGLSKMLYLYGILAIISFLIALVWIGKRVETANKELEDVSNSFLTSDKGR